MNPKLSGWRFPLRYSIKRKIFISYGLNTTLIGLVHPYNEETEGGRLLREVLDLTLRRYYEKDIYNRPI